MWVTGEFMDIRKGMEKKTKEKKRQHGTVVQWVLKCR